MKIKSAILLTCIHVMTIVAITGCKKVATPVIFDNILVLGNSITTSAPAPDYGWYGNWGMAASAEDKDYIHLLQKQYRKINENASITPVNITDWEAFHENYDFSKLDKYFLKEIDLVVIKLGENVSNITHFDKSLNKLIDYITSKIPNVKFLVTGVFWENTSIEAQLKNVAAAKSIPFLGLDHLNTEENRSYLGAKVQDTIDNLYEIKEQAVASHPSDMGMQRIADLLYSELVNYQNHEAQHTIK